MTQQEAHSIVQQECQKRGRLYGQDNEKILRQLHNDLVELRSESPVRFAAIMSRHFGVRHLVPLANGAFRTMRAMGAE